MTGQSYAFPTLTVNFEKVSRASLEASRDRFTENEIRPLFKNAPPNAVLPEDWV